MVSALSSFRICDFTGQLAGAGATRTLAAFGAEVIRERGRVGTRSGNGRARRGPRRRRVRRYR